MRCLYINASWQILEGSTESSGLHLVFLLKSLILLFVVSTFLVGISVSFHSIIVIAGSGDLVEKARRKISMILIYLLSDSNSILSF